MGRPKRYNNRSYVYQIKRHISLSATLSYQQKLQHLFHLFNDTVSCMGYCIPIRDHFPVWY